MVIVLAVARPSLILSLLSLILIMLSLAPPKECKNGDYPSIAIHHAKSIAVCAYESTISKDLYFRIGQVRHDTIQWGEEVKRGRGEYVRVAFYDHNESCYIITVYRHLLWRHCYYQINKLVDNCITFGEPHQFCSGVRPTLAVRSDGTVVVISEVPYSYVLRCHIGKIKDDMSAIDWRQSPDDFSHGTTPTVAINDKHILLLYRIRASSTLKYACGNLVNSEVEWKIRGQYFSTGIRPNVTLNNDHVAVIAHMSFTGRSLYFGHGVVNDQGFMVTGESRSLGRGMHPAVSLSDDNKLIEVHRDNIRSCLWVAQGTYMYIGSSTWATLGNTVHPRLSKPH